MSWDKWSTTLNYRVYLNWRATITITVYKYTLLRNTYKNNTSFSLKIRHSEYCNRKDAITVFSGIPQAIFWPKFQVWGLFVIKVTILFIPYQLLPPFMYPPTKSCIAKVHKGNLQDTVHVFPYTDVLKACVHDISSVDKIQWWMKWQIILLIKTTSLKIT